MNVSRMLGALLGTVDYQGHQVLEGLLASAAAAVKSARVPRAWAEAQPGATQVKVLVPKPAAALRRWPEPHRRRRLSALPLTARVARVLSEAQVVDIAGVDVTMCWSDRMARCGCVRAIRVVLATRTLTP